MITHESRLADIRASWATVETLTDRARAATATAFGSPALFFIADAVHALPYLLAFDVLKDTMLALRDEGHLSSKSEMLGALVRAAEQSLSWRDHAGILAAINARNDLAHDAKVPPRAKMWEQVGLLRDQLQDWHVLL